MPEWLKGADCKSVGDAYDGSNPSLPTRYKSSLVKQGCFCIIMCAGHMKNEVCLTASEVLSYIENKVLTFFITVI